ncbi:MAG: hypothetical protein Q9180_007433 [Flavoplaca navasiana]
MKVAKKTPEETTRLVSSEQRKRRRRIADEDEGEEEAESTLPKPRKRRREVEESDDDAGENGDSNEDLSAQVKRLRRELQEKDERLKKLEGIVELLTKRNVQPAEAHGNLSWKTESYADISCTPLHSNMPLLTQSNAR